MRYDCLKLIKKVYQLPILGIFVNASLKWSNHVDNAIKRAGKILYLLRVLKPLLPKKKLIILHNALIQSIFDYGSQLYVGALSAKDKRDISRLVKRSHRIICGPLCRETCLPDPETRRLTLSLRLFQKALHDSSHVLHPRVPEFLPSGRGLRVPLHPPDDDLHHSFLI